MQGKRRECDFETIAGVCLRGDDEGLDEEWSVGSMSVVTRCRRCAVLQGFDASVLAFEHRSRKN